VFPSRKEERPEERTSNKEEAIRREVEKERAKGEKRRREKREEEEREDGVSLRYRVLANNAKILLTSDTPCQKIKLKS